MADKIEELIIHIAHKSENDPSFGLTKLNKILFASDFFHFGYYGKSITGESYVHRERGPVPKMMVESLQNLGSSGRIQISERLYYGYPQKRVIPLSGANLSEFNKEEVALVENIIEQFKNFNGRALSEWTHQQLPWLVTDEGHEIPYSSVFVLRKLPVEKAGIEWAEKELEKLGMDKAYAN